MKRKVLTFAMRALKYILKAVMESLRKDIAGKKDSVGKES